MQRIVSQSVSASHAHFSTPQRLLLSTPRIAGLLPAHVPAKPCDPSITVIMPRESLRDRQYAIWAAQDAELDAFLEGARQRLNAVYAEVAQDCAAYTTPPVRTSGRLPHDHAGSPSFPADE